MQNNQNNAMINNLLNLLNNRVDCRSRQNVVHGSAGKRVVSESIEDTGVGSNNETENAIVENTHIFDCGHVNNNNLGGECHFCDSIICKDCISVCSSCGHSICPCHTTVASFGEIEKTYCNCCAKKIAENLKSTFIKNAIGKGIASFFCGTDKD